MLFVSFFGSSEKHIAAETNYSFSAKQNTGGEVKRMHTIWWSSLGALVVVLFCCIQWNRRQRRITKAENDLMVKRYGLPNARS
jgi:hypothetical protein